MVRYYANGKETHAYSETWEKTEYHCPHCGVKEVWCEQGYGDVYVGVKFMCVACGSGFYMPDGEYDMSNDEQGKQRLNNLRHFIPNPTLTPRCVNVTDAEKQRIADDIEAQYKACGIDIRKHG